MQWLLASWAAGLVVGVVVGDRVRPVGEAPWPWWALVGVALVGAAVLASVGLASVRQRAGVVLVVLGAVWGFGAHVGAGAAGAGVPEESYGAWSLLRGEVVSGARLRGEGRASVRVALDRCGEVPCSGVVLVGVEEEGRGLVTGDRVWIGGVLEAPEAADAPWLFDGARWMAREGLAGRVVGEIARVRGSRSPMGRVDRWRLEREEAWARRHGEARVAFLLAMVTGSRGFVGAQAREPIDAAGLSHLFAISGLHLATVAGLASLVERLVRRRRRHWLERRWVRWGLALLPWVLIGLYGTLSGWPVSARRAAVMYGGWSLSQRLEREASLEVGLAAAVTLEVMVDSTHALWDPGLQLSVCAVLGLAVAVGETQARGWVGWVRTGLLVSLGSTAACMPWTVLHFGRVPVLGLVLNLVAVPLVQFVVLPVGLVAFAVGDNAPGAALTWIALVGLEVIGRLAEACPWAGFEARLVWGGGLWAVVAGAAVAARRWPRAALAWVGVGSVLCALWAPDRGNDGEVWFLPVGQGDAILLVDPSGRRVLVDGGGAVDAEHDPGRRVVVPALRSMGVRRLDVVVVSHGDLDHIGGLVAAVEAFAPREVWWSGPRGQGSVEQRLLRAAARVGAVVREPPEEAALGALRFRRVDRPAPWHGVAHVAKNDRSCVLEVNVAGLLLLLPGDVEASGEWRALPEVRPVHVLKAAHHGSRTSSSPELLARARPWVVVVQAGRGNRFGHPHPEVVARYRARGAAVVDTRSCGAVWIGVQEGRVVVATHRRCQARTRSEGASSALRSGDGP